MKSKNDRCRMMKIKKIIVPILALLLLSSCGGEKIPTEEIRAALDELLPKSAELNEIYFGEGLPITVDEELVKLYYESFDVTFSTDEATLSYQPVDPASGYSNETELREATLEVFSEEYSEYLFERAFKGISAVFSEGTDREKTVTSAYAMYLEQNGILTARVNISDEAMELGRTYDLDGMEVLRESDGYVIVKVPSEMNGVQLDIELKLVKTEAGWRLDSPTY